VALEPHCSSVLANCVQPVDYLILDCSSQLHSMCIKQSCGELHEFYIVHLMDELGSELVLLPQDGCTHPQGPKLGTYYLEKFGNIGIFLKM
jgi:hypothetical protein